MAGLRTAFAHGRLTFRGRSALRRRRAFRAWLRSLYQQPWVVYAKPPFGSPAHVLHYLAQYTHRVAISNHRLVDVTDDPVSFRWKDYRHGSQVRTLRARRRGGLRRFLLHVLPKRFVRIRYFGLLASRCRTHELATVVRRSLSPHPHQPNRCRPHVRASWPCPRCGAPMRIIDRFTARQLFLEAVLADSMTARRPSPTRHPSHVALVRATAGGVSDPRIAGHLPPRQPSPGRLHHCARNSPVPCTPPRRGSHD